MCGGLRDAGETHAEMYKDYLVKKANNVPTWLNFLYKSPLGMLKDRRYLTSWHHGSCVTFNDDSDGL